MSDHYCDRSCFHTSRLRHLVKHMRVEAGRNTHARAHCVHGNTRTSSWHAWAGMCTRIPAETTYGGDPRESMRAHMHGHAHGRHWECAEGLLYARFTAVVKQGLGEWRPSGAHFT